MFLTASHNGAMLTPRPLVLHTADGVRLSATHWDPGVRDVGCVVAHGFTMHSNRAPVQRICRVMAGHGLGVIAPDFRGHGRSAGYVTAGADEVHDVAAAVSWLRNAGYARVAVLGWSMGGAAVLRYAGLGGDADAVVSVSSAGTWFERGTRSMRVLHWAFETRTGRATTRVVKRTRISPGGWPEVPKAPADVAGGISPRPLLIVHGEQDRYLPVAHAERIAAAAPAAEVWIEPEMGHAEIATTEELADRLARWVLEHCADHAVDRRG